jgi:hypothetical protein
MGYTLEIVEQTPHIYVLFHSFPLPNGIYNKTQTDLLIFTSAEYPNAGFDMFWTDQSLTLTTNAIPRSAESVEQHLNKPWRRFSWHLNRPWNPATDDLLSYVALIEERLRKG